MYAFHAEKGIKLSKDIKMHIQKCLKYTFAKNQGDKDGLQENLKAIKPHQFGFILLWEILWFQAKTFWSVFT